MKVLRNSYEALMDSLHSCGTLDGLTTPNGGASVDASMDNGPTPADLFEWWCNLRTPATKGTTLADWESVQYLDAWCFSRGDHSDNEAYLIRGNGLTQFGRNHDTIESAYRMLSQHSRPQPVESRVVQRWLVWLNE